MTAAADSTPIIDVWMNMFTPEVCHRVYVETPEMKQVVDWWGVSELTQGMEVPRFIEVLDEAKIAKAIIPSIKMWAHQRRALCYSVAVLEEPPLAAAAK